MVGLGCDRCCAGRQMSGYLMPTPVRFRGLSRANPVRRRRGVTFVSPNYRFLGDASSAGVPAGTRLSYTAAISPPGGALMTLDSLVAKVAAYLKAQWNIAVVGSTYPSFISTAVSTGPYTVTLQLQTLTDYGAMPDVQSILDGAWYNVAGATSAGSSLSVLSNPSSVGTPPPGPNPPFDLPTWLSNNWPLLAVAGVGAFAVKELL